MIYFKLFIILFLSAISLSLILLITFNTILGMIGWIFILCIWLIFWLIIGEKVLDKPI